jgi:hypothetical protein
MAKPRDCVVHATIASCLRPFDTLPKGRPVSRLAIARTHCPGCRPPVGSGTVVLGHIVVVLVMLVIHITLVMLVMLVMLVRGAGRCLVRASDRGRPWCVSDSCLGPRVQGQHGHADGKD